ncbi:MAG: choice-of-anchor X domain-containing protein [bacterium]|nr:choice-of-anchor X domain-containing protein [bacterium]
MAFKIRLLLLVVLIFNLFCDKRHPITPVNQPPILSQLSVPDTMFTQSGQSYVVTVIVTDADGRDDVARVEHQIVDSQEQTLATGQFFDDGDYTAHGDNIARDGKYSAKLILAVDPGNYRLTAVATDLSDAASAPLHKNFIAIAGDVNHAPLLFPVYMPEFVVVDTVVDFVLKMRAEDPDEGDAVSRVSFQIFGPTLTQLAAEGELFDDGSHGDSLAGDGIFTLEMDTQFASWQFGNFHLYVQAYDSKQKSSESIYRLLPWVKMNTGVAPVISDLSAPDTVKLPQSDAKSFLISVKAVDDDHYNDIKEVFFNTYKPDGSLSQSSPLQLYDNGTSGDETASDSIYSLLIWIGAENDAGDYRFEFEARDYSDLLSNKIIHVMTVVR